MVMSFSFYDHVHNASMRHPQCRCSNSHTQPSSSGKVYALPSSGSADTVTAQDGEGDYSSSAWQPNAASSMTRRGSWLDVQRAASSHDPDHASLLADYRPSTASEGMPLPCSSSAKVYLLLLSCTCVLNSPGDWWLDA